VQLLRRKESTAHCPGNGSRRSRNKLGPVVTESQDARSQQCAYHAGQDRPIGRETAATSSREQKLADRAKQGERNVTGYRLLAGVFKKRSSSNESHWRKDSKNDSKRDSDYKG
jgi:hypothetical protein